MALTDNLVSYWALDEASGDALDSHSTNDLTDTNTVGSGTGHVSGTARSFTRANTEYFVHADNADLSTGDIDFTLMAWVNPTSLTGTRTIIAKNFGFEFMLYHMANERLEFDVASFSAAVLINNAFVANSGWHLVFAWHDSVGNTINLQLDNASPVSTSWSGGLTDSAGNFRIGDDQQGSPWDGLIGPAAMWKRVLSSQDRTDLWNSGAGLAYPFSGGSPVVGRGKLKSLKLGRLQLVG